MDIFIGWIVLSIIAGLVASNRGNGFGPAFFLSLILTPLIGLIFALVQPSKDKVEQDAARRVGSYGGFRKCPFCAEAIRIEATKCRYCGSDVSDAPIVHEPEKAFAAPPPIRPARAVTLSRAGDRPAPAGPARPVVRTSLLVTVGVVVALIGGAGIYELVDRRTRDTEVITLGQVAVVGAMASTPKPTFGNWAGKRATIDGRLYRVGCGTVTGRTPKDSRVNGETWAFFALPDGERLLCRSSTASTACAEMYQFAVTASCLNSVR